MPDNRRVPSEGVHANPAFRMFLVFLVFVAVALALALGKTWKERLHWTGTVLLITGILLAAEGISQVRREWTHRPGVWGISKHKAHLACARAATFLWVRWNRAVEMWPRVAAWPHLRNHETHKSFADVGAAVEQELGLEASFTGHRGPAAKDSTAEERLENLEARLTDAEWQLDVFEAWRRQADRRWTAELGQERTEREASDQTTRKRIADYAGGGLRLQAWGVVCLLAGTVLTALS